MKWIIRILLSAAVAMVLSACSDTENKETEKAPPPVEEDSNEGTDQNLDVEEDVESPEENEEVPGEGRTKEIVAEIRDTINTDIEVELPEDMKVAEGKYLSAKTTSNAESYEVAFYETDEPVDINAAQLEESEPIMLVKGARYASTEEAKEQIGYQEIQEGMPEVDLGYDITGYQDAGAGSSFITWHEGRWSMIVRARNDEAGNAAGLDLSTAIVEKLETQTLPVPHENGAGTFSSWDHDEVDTNRIAWQEEEVVYEVSMADPLALIDFVTEGFGK